MDNQCAISQRRNPVLVVDDDADFRHYMTSLLEAEEIPCITAGSIAEALNALKQNKISLLLLDWCLDKVATEVVRAAQSISPLMPIIVMSGRSFDVKMDALFLQADEFQEKTIGGSALASRVKRWISRLEAIPELFLPQCEDDILSLDEVKRRYTRHVVGLLGNNISLAAQKLGVHRQTVSAVMALESVEAGKEHSIRPGETLTHQGRHHANEAKN